MIMEVQTLIDPKQARRAKDAIKRRDSGFFRKPLFESERVNLNAQLILASRTGDLQKVKDLLNERAEVNTRDKDENTPLMISADKGHLKVVELLIDAGADIDAVDGHLGYTSLMKAADKTRVRVAKLLVEKGADINAKSKYGRTALELARVHGPRVTEILKEAGATE